MARIFIVDGREFPDPDPTLSVEEVKKLFADFMPEISTAETTERKDGDTTVITFTKKVGTKGDTEGLDRYIVKKLQEWLDKAKSPDFIVSITPVDATQWMVTILKVR